MCLRMNIQYKVPQEQTTTVGYRSVVSEMQLLIVFLILDIFPSSGVHRVTELKSSAKHIDYLKK